MITLEIQMMNFHSPLTSNEVHMESKRVQSKEDLCACGEESVYGCHGFKDNEIYDVYYCEKCYNKQKRG